MQDDWIRQAGNNTYKTIRSVTEEVNLQGDQIRLAKKGFLIQDPSVSLIT